MAKKKVNMSDVDHSTAEMENQYHHYTGNAIPWYVRLMWLGFWILAIAYTIRLLFPAMQAELFKQP
jgi:hypothetical protein